MNRDEAESLDPDVAELYGSLHVDTVPPPLEAVADRIVGRRRRRRTVLVCSAAAVVAAVAVGVGSGDRGQDSEVAVAPENMLTVTRPDGSTFSFTEFTVTCEIDETAQESILVHSGPRDPKGEYLRNPIFYLSMPVENGDGEAEVYPLPPKREPADREPGEGEVFPPGFVPEQSPFVLFVATEGEDDNEVTSSMPGADGTFEVGGAACGAEPSIDFTIDGSLGSEVEQPPLAIVGEVSLG